MENTLYPTVHEYITQQEASYKLPIPINDSWQWSMMTHIKTSVLYKHSQLLTGKNDYKPVKNITRPILNLQYRAEGFDVKDINHYVDDKDDYYKSFLVKKFYEKWARGNNIDTVIDAMVESYVDFGGALLKQVNGVPEVVPLESIAFCDQTDILSGPIGIRHYYSPDQLLDMEKVGWGNPKNGATASLKETIRLSREEKEAQQTTQTAKTPGKYIEVYEVHGVMPNRFLDHTDTSGDYSRQLFIGCFYQKKGSGERGFITLFHVEESKSPFKFIKRDPVYGRALGFGGAEELFEAQVWINYDMIRMQSMLDAAAKTILKAVGANSSTIATRNNIRDLENLSIVDVGMDSDLQQVDTFPRNLKLFENSIANWEAHAQQMGAANDSIMGEAPSSGTPFKLQELVTAESHSLHEYRKGKLATFWDEVERDWIIPLVYREIVKGSQFLADLDIDELRYVSDAIVTCQTNDFAKKRILAGEDVSPEMLKAYEEIVRGEFKKKGNKHFIEIFKDEMKDLPLDVKTNIAGKQKQMAQTVDRIVNIFRFVFSNPAGFSQVMQVPGMANAFSEILEFSGLSPVDFQGIDKIIQQPSPPQTQQTAPAIPPIEAPQAQSVLA